MRGVAPAAPDAGGQGYRPGIPGSHRLGVAYGFHPEILGICAEGAAARRHKVLTVGKINVDEPDIVCIPRAAEIDTAIGPANDPHRV